MNTKPPITVKQRLCYIRLVERIFEDEHTRNAYYKNVPRSKNEADEVIRRLLARLKHRIRSIH